MYNDSSVHFFYDQCHYFVDLCQQCLCLVDIFTGIIRFQFTSVVGHHMYYGDSFEPYNR